MYKILIRFLFINNGRIMEVYLDDRLSFNDNLKLISNITNLDNNEYLVYDPIRKIFLDRNIPLNMFEIETFRMFYLFACIR